MTLNLKTRTLVYPLLMLSLTFAGVAAQQRDRTATLGLRAPNPLPVHIEDDARPLNIEIKVNNPAELMWLATDYYAVGNSHKAIETWLRMPYDAETASWKHLSVARAFLDLRLYEAAHHHADLAMVLDATNPMPYIVRAYTLVHQSRAAPDYHEAPVANGLRRVAYHAPARDSEPEKTKDALLSEARIALAKALTLVDRLDENQLVTREAPYAECGMSVGELLNVLHLENWVAESHLLLARLETKCGSWAESERNLDVARKLGLSCPASYRKLAKALAEEGDYRAAARVNAKSIAAGGSLLHGVLKVAGNAASNWQP